MSDIKLLPCPFCGGKFEEINNTSCKQGDNWLWSTECMECGLFIEDKDKENLIKRINTRKPMERIIERIENARQKYQRLVKEQGEKEDEAINILFRGMMNIVKEEGGIE